MPGVPGLFEIDFATILIGELETVADAVEQIARRAWHLFAVAAQFANETLIVGLCIEGLDSILDLGGACDADIGFVDFRRCIRRILIVGSDEVVIGGSFGCNVTAPGAEESECRKKRCQRCRCASNHARHPPHPPMRGGRLVGRVGPKLP